MADRAAAFGPGRVNLIGEHTDYNGGLALPFAISEGVTVRVQQLGAPRVQVLATDLGECDEFALHDPSPAEGWRAFVRGAVAELQRDGVELPGARLEFSGTVPRGGGLSSSAALEVALALALGRLAGVPEPDRLALARMCSRVETRWVGAQTGLLDQLASLFGRERHALRIDFRSLEVTPVALALGDHRLVTLDSGEQHAHAGSGYNQRRRECEEACRRLGLVSLREASLPMARTLPAPLAQRAEHVISENARVEEAVLALAGGDLNRLGELLNASHASLRDHYEISTPAVEEAVARLRAAGAVGARIIGGGFGGNVLGLLPGDAATLEGAIEVRPSPGAHLLCPDRARGRDLPG
ncbi:MAG: galactokinase [Actinomycetota bacterium]|nr:galactokinase [Actinomycetota bacterium]